MGAQDQRCAGTDRHSAAVLEFRQGNSSWARRSSAMPARHCICRLCRSPTEPERRSGLPGILRDSAPSKGGNARSPTIIAGLRRVATLPWLHFVASPQREPGIGHRLGGRPVVDFIYRAPPRRGWLQHRRCLAANSGEYPAAGCCTRDRRYPRLLPEPRASIHQLPVGSPTGSDYAGRLGVSSGIINNTLMAYPTFVPSTFCSAASATPWT